MYHIIYIDILYRMHIIRNVQFRKICFCKKILERLSFTTFFNTFFYVFYKQVLVRIYLNVLNNVLFLFLCTLQSIIHMRETDSF